MNTQARLARLRSFWGSTKYAQNPNEKAIANKANKVLHAIVGGLPGWRILDADDQFYPNDFDSETAAWTGGVRAEYSNDEIKLSINRDIKADTYRVNVRSPYMSKPGVAKTINAVLKEAPFNTSVPASQVGRILDQVVSRVQDGLVKGRRTAGATERQIQRVSAAYYEACFLQHEKPVLDVFQRSSDAKFIKVAIDMDEPFQVIDFVRGYKQITGVRRIPVAKVVGKKTKQEQTIVGNKEIDKYGVRISGKDYLSDSETEELFAGEVVIEEKVDGHPVVVLYGGYTFFCESLRIQHTVEYDNVPYSEGGWPDMTVVYDVMDGEHAPPYQKGQGTGKWLSRGGKESLCSLVGAPLVPLVFRGRVQPEDLPKLASRFSSFGAGTAEGLVIKNLKTGVFGKFINVEFQQAISEEALWGDGVHPEMRGIKNLRR